jgi:calcineurin-like phosphoesterase family protein
MGRESGGVNPGSRSRPEARATRVLSCACTMAPARMLRFASPGLFLLAMASCGRNTPEEHAPPPETAAVAAPAPVNVAVLSSILSRPAKPRVVAIGDLHGDLDHARRALRLAGAIDEHDQWVGGPLVVVQTGDEIDRGDDDRLILDLVESLKKQAAATGGELIALLGNHEIMNASADFRYVTPGGFAAFSLFARGDAGPLPEGLPREAAGRAAAFLPPGVYAKVLEMRPFLVKVGDSVFVHGGILPKHVAYGLDRMNDELDAWLDGKRPQPPAPLVAEDGPVWTREYSADPGGTDCADLGDALARLGARRMVVGHTVQNQGVNSACDGRVWRIDVGLSHYYGGPIQALELRGDQVTVLREPAE